MFHTISEEDVVLPRLLQEQLRTAVAVGGGGGMAALAAAACDACRGEHANEMTYFEELGRRLADLRALVRRGRKVGGWKM